MPLGCLLSGNRQTSKIHELMSREYSYQDTLDYLYSFVDHSLTRNLRNLPEHFDLDRMRAFMDYLGHPERDFPVLHVAGTKGKGSVCAYCASALQAAGYRTGLFTSPHLWDYNERIAVDRIPVSHASLIDLVNEIRPYLDDGTRLTTFEITTGLAFLYFSKMKVDAVVAEVGLGGRLDATNVVDPLLTVITSISYDHTQVLGNTLAEIAFEKCGIIKPQRPVITAPQKEEALEVIQRVALERQAPLYQVGVEFQFSSGDQTLDGQYFKAWQADSLQEAADLHIPLLGMHQVENATTAFAALQIASQNGLEVPTQAIQSGFAGTIWPGRFQILRRKPPIVVDAAHNRDAARRLQEALNENFPAIPIIMVFGASEDKDILGMMEELSPRLHTLVVTRSYHPRAIDPSEIMERVRHLNVKVISSDEVEDGFKQALSLAGDDKLVLVTGSVFVAAGVLQYWYNQTEF